MAASKICRILSSSGIDIREDGLPFPSSRYVYADPNGDPGVAWLWDAPAVFAPTPDATPAKIIIAGKGDVWAKAATLEAARVDPLASGRTVIITAPLTEAESNIVAAWPTDRILKIEFGGSIANSTAFAINGEFKAGVHQVFAGSGAVTGLKTALPEWWGANVSRIDNEIPIQKAADCARSSSGTLIFRDETIYRTSGTFTVKSNIKTTSGARAFIRPRGAFTAIEVDGGIAMARFGDLDIDYAECQVAVDENCLAISLMANSTTASAQIAFSTFENIKIWRAYRGICYDASADPFNSGQLYQVEFRQIHCQSLLDYGLYLRGTTGTLGVEINNFDSTVSGKGIYAYSLAGLNIRSVAIQGFDKTVHGGAIYCASIHSLSMDSIQIEGASSSDPSTFVKTFQPIHLTVCDTVSIELRATNIKFDPGEGKKSALIGFGTLMLNVNIRLISAISCTIVSGNFYYFAIAAPASNPNLKLFVSDVGVDRANSFLGEPPVLARFASDLPAY